MHFLNFLFENKYNPNLRTVPFQCFIQIFILFKFIALTLLMIRFFYSHQNSWTTLSLKKIAKILLLTENRHRRISEKQRTLNTLIFTKKYQIKLLLFIYVIYEMENYNNRKFKSQKINKFYK